MERTSYRKLFAKALDLLKSSGIENVEYDIKAILTDTFGLDLNKFISTYQGLKKEKCIFPYNIL